MPVSQTLSDLQQTTVGAVAESKETAVATVSELLETHGTLRSDTTALLERLREANSLLQEVLGGAQTNLSSIEHVLSARVAEFVSTIGDLLEHANSTSGKMDEHVSSFYGLTSKVLGDLGDLAVKFDGHGRSLTETVDLLEKSNKHSLAAVTDRHATIEGLVNMLNERTEDLDARLKRFSGMLDESLHVAEDRARDIARLVAEATSEGARSIAEQHDDHPLHHRGAGPAHARFAPQRLRAGGQRQQGPVPGDRDRRPPVAAAGHRPLLRRHADHAHDVDGDAARIRSRPARSCAAACWSCPRRPRRAPRRCGG